jgi:hypothetical protein
VVQNLPGGEKTGSENTDTYREERRLPHTPGSIRPAANERRRRTHQADRARLHAAGEVGERPTVHTDT